ncbi:MAG: efflux RND transporter permease subunit [Polyangiaceae bacterium]
MLKQLVERLSDLQIRRPWVPLLVVGAITVVFGYFAAHLELRTRYDQLLPESQPSVIELHRVEAHTTSAQQVMILLEAPTPAADPAATRAALRAMGDAIVPKLLALGPGVISSAEDGTQEARAFLLPRSGLFLDEKELHRLHEDVTARWDYEVAKEQDALLDDSGPPVTVEDIERRFEKKAVEKGAGSDSGDDPRQGYYERKDGTALVVVARSPIPGGDLARTGPALERVEAVVEQVRESRPEFANIHAGYAGDMATGFGEYKAVRDDLLSVGASGIVLVLSAVVLYFMRLRALVVMGLSIGIALVWTFGITQIFIGYLNVATGFLASIVAGNGINVGILYQSRYFEERRNGVPIAEALRTAVRSTWQPTVIAAVASAASYVGLLVTGFSAFRQFGFIAATGMLICWVVKTLVVPPMLLLSERRQPLDAEKKTGVLARMRRFGLGYGRLFAWLVPKAPRLLLAIGVAIAVVGVYAGVRYVREDPMEYDMHATENDPQTNAELHRIWDRIFDVMGEGHGGMVVLADTPGDAHLLEKKLQADRDAAPADAKPFVAVHSLWDLVPDHQAEKLPELLEIGDKLTRAHERHYLSDEDWDRVKDKIPPPDLKPFGIADLPEPLARPYSEKDGTRGRLVVIEPYAGSQSDFHYIMKYADSFRETRLPNGKIVHGSGRDVIFADILEEVVHDIPRAVGLSLALTLVTVIVTFRRGGLHALSVLFALLVGVAGEAAFLYYARVRINFLNFAALPITFGIGVDYAVNVVQRYRADGNRSILDALRTTGGAVVLCSLTTMLGYLALVGSHNRAIRSLGTIAVVGEVSCLLAAVTFLPALWLLIQRRQRGGG